MPIELTAATQAILRSLSVAHRAELRHLAPLLQGLLGALDRGD